MAEICSSCGLPKELCVCESIAKESQQIKVFIEKRKFGKKYTIIEGLSDIDIKDLTKKLKNKLACGGTSKGNNIELQGDHKNGVINFLMENGFSRQSIIVE